jgi:hypothetical protein
MKNLKEYLENLQGTKLITSTRAGSPTIKSTQRNKIKHDIEKATLKDFMALLEDLVIAEKTDKGIILALEHNDLLRVSDASGEICFEINIKVKNLDYDIVNQRASFERDLELKEEKKKAQAENKKRKIKRDTIKREQKKMLEERNKANR